MRIIIFLVGIVLTLTLTQCASFNLSRRVSQQGNLLSSSRIDRLKIGMSKEEVAIIMGSSLHSQTFNNDRWDYTYTWRRGHGPLLVSSISLYFVHERLTQVDRDKLQHGMPLHKPYTNHE